MIEVFGVHIHFGHPVVNELAGVEDLVSNTGKDIKTDRQILREVSGSFNRTFILSFIDGQNAL